MQQIMNDNKIDSLLQEREGQKDGFDGFFYDPFETVLISSGLLLYTSQ